MVTDHSLLTYNSNPACCETRVCSPMTPQLCTQALKHCLVVPQLCHEAASMMWLMQLQIGIQSILINSTRPCPKLASTTCCSLPVHVVDASPFSSCTQVVLIDNTADSTKGKHSGQLIGLAADSIADSTAQHSRQHSTADSIAQQAAQQTAPSAKCRCTLKPATCSLCSAVPQQPLCRSL